MRGTARGRTVTRSRSAVRTGDKRLGQRAQPPKAQRLLGIGIRKKASEAPAGKVTTARHFAKAKMTLATPREAQSNLNKEEPNVEFAPAEGPVQRMPEVGEMAPDFELPDQDGNPVRLDSFRGQKVVVYFYPKDDTPGCTIEAQGFRDDYELLQEKGIVVLGISKDDTESHKAFADKYGLNFRLLSDTTGETIQNYGCWVEKDLYGIRRMGIQRATFLIDEEGKILRVWPRVTPEGHSREILAAV